MDPEQTWRRAVIPGTGPVQAWTDLTSVEQDLVSFQMTFVFEHDGAVLTSDSTLRFRSRAELTGSLTAAGLIVDEVRGAPDRPTRALVTLCDWPCSWFTRASPPIWSTGCPGLIAAGTVRDLNVRSACETRRAVQMISLSGAVRPGSDDQGLPHMPVD